MAKPYISDITHFLQTLKQLHPTLEAEQRTARERWWDKTVDRNALAQWRAQQVPVKPYAYQTD